MAAYHTTRTHVAAALPRLLDLLAPRRCPACDHPFGSTSPPLCEACRPGLLPHPGLPRLHPWGPVWIAGRYGGPLRDAVHRMKFERRPDVARSLGRWLAEQLAGRVPPRAVLVPVPLHPLRLAERGFDQAVLLARAAAPKWRGSVRLCLRRAIATTEQSRLPHASRWANTSRAFATAGALPRRAFLVDDVTTTGATLSACAEALHEAGVEIGGALVLAGP